MSKLIDLERLTRVLEPEPGLLFALVFGSARTGELRGSGSDVDVALYLDHEPDLDERARLLGFIQDVVGTDRVDVVFLNMTENAILRRETLKGRLLFCRDREAYASFFSLADRRGRDEEERIARGWRLRRELADTGAGQSGKA